MRSSTEAVLAIFKRAVYDARLWLHGCAYIVSKLGKHFASPRRRMGILASQFLIYPGSMAGFGTSGNAAIIMPGRLKA
jgi:hypothetical protein